MFCSKCGFEVSENTKFCPKCGTPLPVQAPVNNEPAPAPQAPQSPKKSSKAGTIIISVAATLGVLIILFVLIGIFAPKDDSDGDSKKTEDKVSTSATVAVSAGNASNDGKQSDADVKKAMDELFLACSGLSEIENIDGTPEGIDHAIDLLNDARNKIGKVEGLPENVEKAADDSLKLFVLAFSTMKEQIAFFSDVQAVIAEIEGIDENDAKAMLKALRYFHDSIECPENYESSWDKIAQTIAVLNEASERTDLAVQCKNDPVRAASADLLAERGNSLAEKAMSLLEDTAYSEQLFYATQIDKAYGIFEEIKKLSDSSADEIINKKFDYNFENELYSPEYKFVDTIYPSVYNAYDSFVIIKLGCLSGEKDVIIECEIEGLSQKFVQSYHIGSALTILNIKPSAVLENVNLDKPKDSQIRVTIKDKKTGAVLDEQSHKVHIASRNDFNHISDEFLTVGYDNFLCFLTPLADAVTTLKREAVNEMAELSDGAMNSLDGYQESSQYFNYDFDGNGELDTTDYGCALWLNTYVQAASMCRAMSDLGVRYVMDGFSLEDSAQHILFPDQVLSNKSGLCIETALLIASALQSADFNTYIILTLSPGHAQVAVEIYPGTGQYFLIETTKLPNELSDYKDDIDIFFNGEIESDSLPIGRLSEDYISGRVVIDCSDGNLLGFTPFE